MVIAAPFWSLLKVPGEDETHFSWENSFVFNSWLLKQAEFSYTVCWTSDRVLGQDFGNLVRVENPQLVSGKTSNSLKA